MDGWMDARDRAAPPRHLASCFKFIGLCASRNLELCLSLSTVPQEQQLNLAERDH
jgi:hypothetical protein